MITFATWNDVWFWLIVLACSFAALVLFVFFFAWYGVTFGQLKEKRAAQAIQDAKLETERLRQRRLTADIMVVTARGQKLSNDVVKSDIEIERWRRAAGYRPDTDTDGTDKASW